MSSYLGFVMFLTLMVYFDYYSFYSNIKCNVGSNKKTTQQMLSNWHVITLFLLD